VCTVETVKERVLFSDVEEHLGVDVSAILSREEGKMKDLDKCTYSG